MKIVKVKRPRKESEMPDLVGTVGELKESYAISDCRVERKGYLSLVSFQAAGESYRHELMDRGDASVILPVNFYRRELYLVEQARYVKSFVDAPSGKSALKETLENGSYQDEFEVNGGVVHCMETPGGFIEGKESPLDAAKRELLEETGLVVAGSDFLHVVSVFATIGACTERLHCYMARLPELPIFVRPVGDGFERLRVWKFSWDEAFYKVQCGYLENAATNILLRELMIMDLRKKDIPFDVYFPSR